LDKLYLIVVEKSSEEVAGRSPNPCWKKEGNTTISVILGVGISSPALGCHCSTTRLGRKEFTSVANEEEICKICKMSKREDDEKLP
jgi:hypothetical protein